MFDEASSPGIVSGDFFIVSPLGIVLRESRSHISIGYSSGKVVIVLPLGIISEEDRHHIATRYHLWGRSSSYRHRVSSLRKVVIISPPRIVIGKVVIVLPPGIVFGECSHHIAIGYHFREKLSSFRHQVSFLGKVIVVSSPGIVSGRGHHCITIGYHLRGRLPSYPVINLG